MTGRTMLGLAVAAVAIFGQGDRSFATERFIVVQSTTSTDHSGLFDRILPEFQEKTGIEVRVVAVGPGQAIKNAANGDGD
ncbi:MAG: sulfate transporter, partial [Rhodospirillales bacterium]|nr:sulfate transporter [Rhodospirillales bacterium]